MRKISSETPFCSVIIPTHERPGVLAGCLQAIAELLYPRERLEVDVVDDGGTTDVEPLIRTFKDELDVVLVRQTRSGPAAARNAGAKQARGEVLAFTDDDCRPAPDWLQTLVEHWSGHEDVAVGGHTVNSLVENVYSGTSQLIIDVGYAQNNRDASRAQFFTSNNLLVPARNFSVVDGFDPSFITSEDRDFCDRWVSRGFRLEYVPAAIVLHRHELTFRTFCRQQFAYGKGAFHFHRAHALRRSRNVRIEPSFYLRLFLHPLRNESGLRAVQLFLLLQIWNVVNVLGFFRAWLSWVIRGERVRGGDIAANELPAGHTAPPIRQ